MSPLREHRECGSKKPCFRFFNRNFHRSEPILFSKPSPQGNPLVFFGSNVRVTGPLQLVLDPVPGRPGGARTVSSPEDLNE